MRFMFVIFLFALLIVSFPVASAVPVNSAVINATLAKYDPFPAEAGRTVTIWIDVSNIGLRDARNVSLMLAPKFPLSYPGGEQKFYSRISALDSVRAEYQLFVDKSAKKENVSFDVYIAYINPSDNSTGYRSRNFTILVNKSVEKTELTALFVEVAPEAVPGEKTNLSVDIINVNKGAAFFTVAHAESPAAIIERNEIFVGELEANDFDSVDFELSIKNSIEPGIYPVNITMFYKDDDSNDLVSSNIVEINVVAERSVSTPQIPPYLYIVYIVVILIIIRLAFPFVRWFIKPFRRKKHR